MTWKPTDWELEQDEPIECSGCGLVHNPWDDCSEEK